MSHQLALVFEQILRFTFRVCLPLIATFLAQPAFGGESGWKIEQSDRLFGPTTTYISRRGVLRRFPKMGGATVSLAPDWKLMFFNDETKMCCVMTMDDWRKYLSRSTVGLRATVPDSLIKQPLAKGRQCTMGGIRTTTYSLQAGLDDARRFKSFRTTQIVNVTLADDIELAPPVARVYADCYCLPFSTKLPLQVEHINSSKRKVDLLSTLKISAMRSTANEIRVPSGYKLVRTALEVTTGGLIDDLLKDVVPSMHTSAPKSAH